MTAVEAFAAIPLAAVCCDQHFSKDEAWVIREQLLCRSAYRAMEPYAFGLLISRLLKRFREESWQGLIAAAAPVLSPGHQETAFALACQLIHCDRDVSELEREFLIALSGILDLSQTRAAQIVEVCALLNRDADFGSELHSDPA
ncbi:tellurite resistance TerB family protein [Synechococcus sp. CBW1004]|uniref:tellurite resistance TerB family protein n=1 Tax=Synechococcus sp. CBW1004 TaxID=1353136 RepID=UPI0018CEF8EB|nr:tellurite resistance TerB family protein [Synechococcus sp. CBW1004]QPN63261.1 tellurite resistance TerB family protein [Synechococcus sp. CBW1004]